MRSSKMGYSAVYQKDKNNFRKIYQKVKDYYKEAEEIEPKQFMTQNINKDQLSK